MLPVWAVLPAAVFLSDRIAIEVKASGRVGERDAKPLHALGDDAPIQTKIIVCSERWERQLDSGVLVMPVARFLEALWGDAIVAVTEALA